MRGHMQQRDYLYGTVEEAIAGVEEIRVALGQRHSDALLHVFSTGIGRADMQLLLDACDARLPQVKRVGASEYPAERPLSINELEIAAFQSVRLNLMMAEKANFVTGQISCVPGGEREAARALAARLAGVPHVRALAIYPSNPLIDLNMFLRLSGVMLSGVPVFGAAAALSFTDDAPMTVSDTSFGIGEGLLESGFTFAAFAGGELHAFLDYVLGWRPIGGAMKPVVASGGMGASGMGASASGGMGADGDKGGPGGAVVDASFGGRGRVVTSIDGKPAIDVYDRYLGVKWSKNFIENVCEFPLMVRRNDVNICCAPLAVGASGELYLATPVYPGETLRFSYATREGVLGASEAGSRRMAEFGAQAVLMSLCGNRVNFLGNEAHAEWDFYRRANPGLAFCHGYCEIGWKDGRGGTLNSALVALGLREGPAGASGGDAGAAGDAGAFSTYRNDSLQSPDYEPLGPWRQLTVRDAGQLGEEGAGEEGAVVGPVEDDGTIPLSYRVARFFDVMTSELLHLQHNLEDEVARKTRENENLSLHLVETLAAAIDAKDAYTNGHSGRVAAYAREIARRAGYSEQRQRDIYVMGVLHDVGKIGVPDAVINKPGKLTDEEFALIKEHPATGARILSAIVEMPELAVGAHWHHERYDGRGYPDGLAGEEIPEEARIIAVADAYDAMTSNRSYRDAMPQAKVREQVERGRGTQFDPVFADIMLDMIDQDADYRMRELSHVAGGAVSPQAS